MPTTPTTAPTAMPAMTPAESEDGLPAYELSFDVCTTRTALPEDDAVSMLDGGCAHDPSEMLAAVKAQVVQDESEHMRRTVKSCESTLETSCAYWLGSMGWQVLTLPNVMMIGLVLREQSVLFERMTESQFSGIVLPGLTKTGSDEIVKAIGADDNMLGAMTVQLSSVTASFKKQTEHAELQASEIW